MSHFTSLKNHFLIAMPSLVDEYFAQTVIYICEHNEKEAMGIIINFPIDLDLGELLENVEIHADDKQIAKQPVFGGGPVQPERGFVLHTYDKRKKKWKSSLPLSDELCITTSLDILKAIANDKGPKKQLVALGCAGWGAGQLEKEMAENSWLSCPANTDILFNTPSHERWQKAAKLMGVDLKQMSFDVGHA